MRGGQDDAVVWKRSRSLRRAKLVVAVSFISNLGILAVFKYAEWILGNINHILQTDIASNFSLVLPVGISFYTFQALSYTLDVYRGEIKPEKNIFRYALFVSFFPQLVAGPIERSKNLLPQVDNVQNIRFSFDNFRNGLCLVTYGLFMKLVVADRVALFVDNVFDNYSGYGFVELVLAAVLFAVQILCDFNGYSTIAIGAAQIMGIQLMKNFNHPYLAISIKDFWRRWHISLTSWFTDYLYIPLGGNRKGLPRKMLNTMIVFFVSGLWHGASWHYVAWGLLHGIYHNIETLVNKARGRPRIKKKQLAAGPKVIRIIVTFILADIAWVFFRADSCKIAIKYFLCMFKSFYTTSLMEIGLSGYDWFTIAAALIFMFIIGILHERGIAVREALFKRNIVLRWIFYMIAFWSVLIFGIYGAAYDDSQFIYFQF